MNAFGDATMALALFLLIQHTGQLDFAGVFAAAPHGGTIANLIALGLLGGAVAKSAQIPLHTWLPDAMEGPTPVSALIHAATMVTAGVYLIVRTHPLFENAPEGRRTSPPGSAPSTLLMAGLIALVQIDIKRVIAYSTMSQIGYMFVGAGVGAYSSAMFHLMTHAFFKALLFLAAGIVIHALAGEQDMRRMGGLRKVLPHTRTVFLIGSLALVGIPPLAGFFSKDAIIAATLDRGDCSATACSPAASSARSSPASTRSASTSSSSTASSRRSRSEHLHKPKGRLEGPLSMVWTVAILAVLSATAGFLQFSPLWHPLTTWLDPVAPPLAEPTKTQEAIASVSRRPARPRRHLGRLRLLRHEEHPVPKPVKLFEKKFYFDELYDAVFYKPADLISRGLGRFFEQPRDRRLDRRGHPGLPLRLG